MSRSERRARRVVIFVWELCRRRGAEGVSLSQGQGGRARQAARALLQRVQQPQRRDHIQVHYFTATIHIHGTTMERNNHYIVEIFG